MFHLFLFHHCCCIFKSRTDSSLFCDIYFLLKVHSQLSNSKCNLSKDAFLLLEKTQCRPLYCHFAKRPGRPYHAVQASCSVVNNFINSLLSSFFWLVIQRCKLFYFFSKKSYTISFICLLLLLLFCGVVCFLVFFNLCFFHEFMLLDNL